MAAIVGCLLLLPIVPLSSLKMPVYGLTILLELLFMLVSLKRVQGKNMGTGFLGVLALFVVYLLARWIVGGLQGGERLVQTGLFLLTLVVFSRYRWRAGSVHTLYLAMSFIVVVSLLYWFVSGRVTNYYAAFYGHSNGFAVVVLATMAVTALDSTFGKRLSHWIVIAVCAVLLLFANSRSATLAAIAAVIVASALVMVKRAGGTVKRVAEVMLFLTVALSLAFSVIYPMLYGTDLGCQLELLSRQYLNKNFFSGREIIWQMILGALNGHDLFGLGLQMTPSMIYETGYSSHNLYLQTMLQSGIIGLALFLGLLWAMLRKMANNTEIGIIGSCVLIAMLLHDCFEVSLTQNNLDYSLLLWGFWGIVLSLERRHNPHELTDSNRHVSSEG